MLLQHDDLVHVLTTLKDIELGHLARLTTDLDRHMKRQKSLHDENWASAQRCAKSGSLAALSRQVLFAEHLAREQAKTNNEIANLAAALEEQKIKAQRALGRLDALVGLIEKEHAQVKIVRHRRQLEQSGS